MSDPAARPHGYPVTPAYGQQHAGPAAPTGTAGARPGGGRPAAPRSALALALGLSLVWNLLSVVGVLFLGWPAGNVFLLFWAENAVLGLCTLVKVATAQGRVPANVRVSGIFASGSPTVISLFFAFHYGLFCLVHLVFTLIVAIRIGIEPTFLLLGFPVLLLALRYTVETITTWFGPGGQRGSVSAVQAMIQPYPRIVVLHVSVLLASGLGLGGFASSSWGEWGERLRPVLAALPADWRTPGVAVVVLLVVVKTVVDLVSTRWALRAWVS